MEKTLQQQYNLIKEGKGSKDDFLKSARRVFPEYISSLTDYSSAVNILKGKSILSEGVGGIATQNSNKPDWFKIFDTNLKETIGEEIYALSNQEIKEKSPITNMSIIDIYNLLSEVDDIDFIQEIGIIISRKDWSNRGDFAAKQKIYKEIQKHIDDKNIVNDLKEEIYRLIKASSKELNEAVGVKDKEEYGDQNTFKVSKETEETLKKANYDNADPKNIDNVYGQSFLMGYYTEMKDPKNEGKTVDELKAIVLKNMAKDINYYHTEASFGVKGIGYKKDVVGGGEPVAPKGKYKSSGYGDMPKTVKEGLNESYDDMYGVDGEDENEAIRQRKKTYAKYKVGDLINFKDGETWKVVEKGMRGSDNRRKENEITIKPHNELAKSRNISLPIDVSLEYIKNNTIDEGKINEYQETVSVGSMVKPSGNEFKIGDTVIFKGTKQKVTRVVDDPVGYTRIYIKSIKYDGRPETWVKAQDLKKAKTNEALDEGKRPNVASEIKEIEKANESLALEAKLNAIDEAIEKRKSKLALAESEELAEMIDQSMVKTLNKEIKELERHKAKTQKIYEKMTGKAKKEVIDEELDENNITEYTEDEFDRSPEMYGRGKSPREGKDMNYNEALKLAKAISREGVVQHVNELPDGSYEISDWYDADTTVISFENGIEI